MAAEVQLWPYSEFCLFRLNSRFSQETEERLSGFQVLNQAGFLKNRRLGFIPLMCPVLVAVTRLVTQLDALAARGRRDIKMAAPRSCVLWRYCGRGWLRATGDCRLPGFRRSWPWATLSARYLSQEKRATETHFGFETVTEEEKGGKGDRARGWMERPVGLLFRFLYSL